MDTLLGIILIAAAGYFVYKWMVKEEQIISEPKIEPAKKIESDFVTGLNVTKEEVKPEVAKVEEVPALMVQHGAHAVEPVVIPVVEEVKKKTRTVKAKAKAVEAVVEAKVEKLEQAVVKKTKTTKAKK